jgi:hypothetical protein
MNMAYNDQDRNFEYQTEEQATSGRDKIQRKSGNDMSYARKRAPSAHNGIHRRRNKRFSW